jgi:hypothetical protein
VKIEAESSSVRTSGEITQSGHTSTAMARS